VTASPTASKGFTHPRLGGASSEDGRALAAGGGQRVVLGFEALVVGGDPRVPDNHHAMSVAELGVLSAVNVSGFGPSSATTPPDRMLYGFVSGGVVAELGSETARCNGTMIENCVLLSWRKGRNVVLDARSEASYEGIQMFTVDEVKELQTMMGQIGALVTQVGVRLASALQDEQTNALPILGAKDAARVEKFGEVAHRHLLAIEKSDGMTLGESLAIRREFFGKNVQSTANLFGTKGSGALFYRKTPYGQVRNDSDPVAVTEEGKRIAVLWRQLHPGAV